MNWSVALGRSNLNSHRIHRTFAQLVSFFFAFQAFSTMVYWGDLGKCSNIRCPDEGSCMSFYPATGEEIGNALPSKCVCGCRGNQHVRLDTPETPSTPFKNVPPVPPRTPAVCLFHVSICLHNFKKSPGNTNACAQRDCFPRHQQHTSHDAKSPLGKGVIPKHSQGEEQTAPGRLVIGSHWRWLQRYGDTV